LNYFTIIITNFIYYDGYDWSRGAFNDWRLNLVFEDAWKYMTKIPKFDGVIIDLTDPDLDKDDWSGLLKMVMASVSYNKGGFVMNAGLYLPWSTAKLLQIKDMIEELCRLNRGYKYYVYTTFIPSFNGEWTFFAVAHQSQFMKEPSHVSAIPRWIRRATRVLDSSLIDIPANTVADVSSLVDTV
jgi:spermidine synthase